MSQSTLLRIIKVLGIFSVQLSGLWPFSYDHKTKKFKFLWYFTIVPIVLIGYPLLVAIFWSKHIVTKILVDNVVLLIVSVTFVVFNSVNFLFIYVSQYWNCTEIKELINKGYEVIITLNNDLDSSGFQYGMVLIRFASKSIIFMLLLVYSILDGMSQYTKFEDHYVVQIMSTLPNLIMKIYPDVFYGGLLLTHFYLKEINDRISSVLTEAQHLSEHNDLSEQKRYQKMINFCALSDKLDRLCVLQCSVIETYRAFFQLCSVQVTLWIMLGLALLLINMFQQYIVILKSVKTEVFSLQPTLIESCSVVLIMFEIWLTCAATDCVIAEVNASKFVSFYVFYRHPTFAFAL